MAITINPITYIINIPKSYLTLVSGTIYKLDTNQFRLDLKDIEDSEQGITMPKTHLHNTEVTIAGTIFARTIEILSPYSIEFEDGQYSVILEGSNNNIFDVANGILQQNQVQIISNNSAGLIDDASNITSFNGMVVIDTVNGVSGIMYPIGTISKPVNNLNDAITIAENNNFHKLKVLSNLLIDSSITLDKYDIYGDDAYRTAVNIDENAIVTNCRFERCMITGYVDVSCYLKKSALYNITISTAIIEECTLTGYINVSAITSDIHIINSLATRPDVMPIIDLTNTERSVFIHGYTGNIKIDNKSADNTVTIDMISGGIYITKNVTNGTIICRGVGSIVEDFSKGAIIKDSLIDNSGLYKPPGGAIRINS